MTAAAGLYTLVRRVSGNIAYAVLATMIERRAQIHHALLDTNINVFNPALRQYDLSASARLTSLGYGSPTFQVRGLSMVNGLLTRQADHDGL